MRPILFLLLLSLFSWSKAQEKTSTREPNVSILSESFSMPQLERERRIWIYLPLSYHTNTSKTYPVLYLHDGQNLFDQATSYSGEWGIDETLNRLTKEGIEEAIVVGIDNGGDKRIEELSPFANAQYGGGKGKEYMAFIVETLKPYIDQNYRTKEGRKHTLLGGSSLGALISVYGAATYPKTFGKVLSFSSAFWFNKYSLRQYLSQLPKQLGKQKYYFIEGTHEMKDMKGNTDAVIFLLKSKGVKDKNIYYRTDEDGKHNEAYWRKEFPAAYQWLMN